MIKIRQKNNELHRTLEELDDVQNVYSNFDISEDIAKEIEEN